MKVAIQNIDRGLKTLNNLAHEHRAEDFLVRQPVEGTHGQGALLIRSPEAEEGTVELGIYLSSPVARELDSYAHWEMTELNLSQRRAFAVAAEEVSHFHYLLRQLLSDREVSRMEMEVQGEVDTFLLGFFAMATKGEEDLAFEVLYRQAFDSFSLVEGLTPQERERYLEANQAARRFLGKVGPLLCHPESRQEAFAIIRRFYRLGLSEKIAWTSP